MNALCVDIIRTNLTCMWKTFVSKTWHVDVLTSFKGPHIAHLTKMPKPRTWTTFSTGGGTVTNKLYGMEQPEILLKKKGMSNVTIHLLAWFVATQMSMISLCMGQCWVDSEGGNYRILFSLFSMTPLGNTKKWLYYRGVVFSLIWQMA
jgi:hypothetical protein